MEKTGAKLTMDDAFTPKRMEFTEGENTITFFLQDSETIRVQVYKGSDFQMGMRVPLYAAAAFAQMFTGTLNGQRLLK
mgnify:CR=1 FL=1